MEEIAQPIDLKLSEKLRDSTYRKKFFLAESSAQIAGDLIALRRKRGLNQTELAEKVGTRQTGISRLERHDYQSWSFSMLRRIADALDARIRVRIEPAEDVIREYEVESKATLSDQIPPEDVVEGEDFSPAVDDIGSDGVPTNLPPIILGGFANQGGGVVAGGGASFTATISPGLMLSFPLRSALLNLVTRSPWANRMPNSLEHAMARIKQLEAENADLKDCVAELKQELDDETLLNSMGALMVQKSQSSSYKTRTARAIYTQQAAGA